MLKTACILINHAFTLLLLFATCAPQLDSPGGSSVSGNARVRGALFDTTGKPAVNALALLVPDGYNPRRDAALNSSHMSTTDSSGAYCFSVADSGFFNVQAFDAAGRAVLIRGILVSPTPDTAHADTVKSSGAIKIALPEDVAPGEGYAFIPGTIIVSDPGSIPEKFIVLKGVPPGLIPNVSVAATRTSIPRILLKNISVAPGETKLIVNSEWKYLKKFVLNTTVQGAYISASVFNFPIFIRLGMGWTAFDFSQTHGRGADIRFTKSDGASLPFEIETWDSLNAYGEIWVKVDTVLGNNDGQSITMYWGNSDAKSASSGGAVFDTAQGFQGVWHFETSQHDTVYDATPNRFHGVIFPNSSALSTPQNIGAGIFFDGSGCFLMPQTASGKLADATRGDYTLFAWVYVQDPDTAFRVIAATGNALCCIVKRTQGSVTRWELLARADTVSTSWQSIADNDPVRYNQWYLLTGVCRSGVFYFYVNGVPVSYLAVPLPDFSAILKDAGGNFTVGGSVSSGGRADGYFLGTIDEVQCHSIARSADWIRLYFQNQQIADSLVLGGFH